MGLGLDKAGADKEETGGWLEGWLEGVRSTTGGRVLCDVGLCKEGVVGDMVWGKVSLCGEG